MNSCKVSKKEPHSSRPVFEIDRMTTDELKQWRRELLFLHCWSDERNVHKESKSFYNYWLLQFGHELNKRCKTTKYLPR